MPKLNAAVVTSFGEPPHYQSFDVPQPAAEDEILVDMLDSSAARSNKYSHHHSE